MTIEAVHASSAPYHHRRTLANVFLDASPCAYHSLRLSFAEAVLDCPRPSCGERDRILRYLFEDYALDTDRRELRRGPTLVAVAPQVFDLLVHLIRHRDRVVSKEDLLASVWHGRIVSEVRNVQPDQRGPEFDRRYRGPATADQDTTAQRHPLRRQRPRGRDLRCQTTGNEDVSLPNRRYLGTRILICRYLTVPQ